MADVVWILKRIDPEFQIQQQLRLGVVPTAASGSSSQDAASSPMSSDVVRDLNLQVQPHGEKKDEIAELLEVILDFQSMTFNEI